MQKYITWREIKVSIALALLIATELVDFWFLYHCFVLIQKDQAKWSERSKTNLPNSAQIFSVQVKNQEKNDNVLCKGYFNFAFGSKSMKKWMSQKLFGRNFFCKDYFNFAFGSKSMKKWMSQKLFGRNFFWKKMLNFRNEKFSKKTEIFLTSWNVLDAFLLWIRKFTYDLNDVNLVFTFSFEKFSEKKKIVFSKKKLVFRLSFIILIFNYLNSKICYLGNLQKNWKIIFALFFFTHVCSVFFTKFYMSFLKIIIVKFSIWEIMRNNWKRFFFFVFFSDYIKILLDFQKNRNFYMYNLKLCKNLEIIFTVSTFMCALCSSQISVWNLLLTSFLCWGSVKNLKTLGYIKLNTSFLIRCAIAKDRRSFDLVSPTNSYSIIFKYTMSTSFTNIWWILWFKIDPENKLRPRF